MGLGALRDVADGVRGDRVRGLRRRGGHSCGDLKQSSGDDDPPSNTPAVTCTDIGHAAPGAGAKEVADVSGTAGTDLPLGELLARRRALVATLRDVEHWRRLAAARLDLAVAAVTDIDELASRCLPCAPPAPDGLRTRVGIPDPGEALPETTALLRLRCVLDELEAYAAALRRCCAELSREVHQRLDTKARPWISPHQRREAKGRVATHSTPGAPSPAVPGSRKNRAELARRRHPRSWPLMDRPSNAVDCHHPSVNAHRRPHELRDPGHPPY